MLRGTVVLAGLAAALLLGLGQGHAQPAPPLHIIVPHGPSGLVDILARLLARKVTENTGRPVIVENKAGASGIIGVQAFLAAAGSPGGATSMECAIDARGKRGRCACLDHLHHHLIVSPGIPSRRPAWIQAAGNFRTAPEIRMLLPASGAICACRWQGTPMSSPWKMSMAPPWGHWMSRR